MSLEIIITTIIKYSTFYIIKTLLKLYDIQSGISSIVMFQYSNFLEHSNKASLRTFQEKMIELHGFEKSASEII